MRTLFIGLAMIVRNEAHIIERCLGSVRGLIDTWTIIDTGSTDRTVEIARQHGAHVGHFEWCNDFAAARNASIAPATGDWILFLDADEELSPAEKIELPSLLIQTQISLYRLPLINTHQGEKSQSYVPRLFRNPPGLMFYGCVHEGVLSFMEKIYRLVDYRKDGVKYIEEYLVANPIKEEVSNSTPEII